MMTGKPFLADEASCTCSGERLGDKHHEGSEISPASGLAVQLQHGAGERGVGVGELVSIRFRPDQQRLLPLQLRGLRCPDLLGYLCQLRQLPLADLELV